MRKTIMTLATVALAAGAFGGVAYAGGEGQENNTAIACSGGNGSGNSLGLINALNNVVGLQGANVLSFCPAIAH